MDSILKLDIIRKLHFIPTKCILHWLEYLANASQFCDFVTSITNCANIIANKGLYNYTSLKKAGVLYD